MRREETRTCFLPSKVAANVAVCQITAGLFYHFPADPTMPLLPLMLANLAGFLVTLGLRAEVTAALKKDLHIPMAGVQVTSLGVLEVGINNASILSC